ncbi:MAG TPA: hypothetical protein VLE22_14095 [Bryobacteraceae bacterium]|nr:hypothetical protein [Bryobacteraceae bacterium]
MGIKDTVIWAVVMAAEVGLAAGRAQQGSQAEGGPLPIFVHDMAGVPDEVLSTARGEMARILSDAGVRVAWLDSANGRPAGTIILRIVPATLDYVDKAALGLALLSGPEAVYATISYPRVQRCIARQFISTASAGQVLGHAMAHEVGHILLGAGSHSENGLMRPTWDERALNDVSKGILGFSRDEARHIQGEVDRRTGGDATRGK